MLSSIRMAVVNSRCLRAHKLAVKVSFPNQSPSPHCTCHVMSHIDSLCVLDPRPSKGGLVVTPEMEEDVISFKEGLYLATMGGARALNIDHQVGLGFFEPRSCHGWAMRCPGTSW